MRVFSYSPTCKIRIEQARDLHEINKGRLATAEAFPVLVKYRLKMTGESSEQITMDPPHIYVERTLAIIKPDALHKSEEIQDIILRSGFAILQVRELIFWWVGYQQQMYPLQKSCQSLKSYFLWVSQKTIVRCRKESSQETHIYPSTKLSGLFNH